MDPRLGKASNNVTLPEQTEGTHTFYVKAKDNAGNNSTYGSHTFRIDTIAPTVTISSPGEGETVTFQNVLAGWIGSDSGSGIDKYEVKLDSGTWINTGTAISHTFNGINIGSHTVYVRATDKAGNSKEQQVNFIYQSVTPTPSPSPSPSPTASPTPSNAFTNPLTKPHSNTNNTVKSNPKIHSNPIKHSTNG